MKSVKSVVPDPLLHAYALCDSFPRSIYLCGRKYRTTDFTDLTDQEGAALAVFVPDRISVGPLGARDRLLAVLTGPAGRNGAGYV